jgi:hypothetical protein
VIPNLRSIHSFLTKFVIINEYPSYSMQAVYCCSTIIGLTFRFILKEQYDNLKILLVNVKVYLVLTKIIIKDQRFLLQKILCVSFLAADHRLNLLFLFTYHKYHSSKSHFISSIYCNLVIKFLNY